MEFFFFRPSQFLFREWTLAVPNLFREYLWDLSWTPITVWKHLRDDQEKQQNQMIKEASCLEARSCCLGLSERSAPSFGPIPSLPAFYALSSLRSLRPRFSSPPPTFRCRRGPSITATSSLLPWSADPFPWRCFEAVWPLWRSCQTDAAFGRRWDLSGQFEADRSAPADARPFLATALVFRGP